MNITTDNTGTISRPFTQFAIKRVRNGKIYFLNQSGKWNRKAGYAAEIGTWGSGQALSKAFMLNLDADAVVGVGRG